VIAVGEMKQLPYHSYVYLEKTYLKHQGRKLIGGVLIHPKGYIPDWVKEPGQTSCASNEKELEEFQRQVELQRMSAND